MDTNYIGREYRAGKSLAEVYLSTDQIMQVRIFKEVAKESDFCILGFCDRLVDCDD